MKKLLPIILILTACSGNQISDLKLNVDKPDDVEAKFGKPDSIVKQNIFGMSAEFWAYRKDSICLLFKNDILSHAQEHCYNGFKPTEIEKKAIEEQANHIADSISTALSKELDNAMENTTEAQ